LLGSRSRQDHAICAFVFAARLAGKIGVVAPWTWRKAETRWLIVIVGHHSLPWGSAMSSVNQRRIPWGAIVGATIVAGLVYLFFFFEPKRQEKKPTVYPAGWSELQDCTETSSFDGKSFLALTVDQSAELTETATSKDGKDDIHVTFGQWNYDPASKKYAITFNGKTKNYVALSMDDVATCILVSGELASANLLESWFSTKDEEPPPDEGTSYDERNEPH
jgi:hypothetical protein